MLTEPTDDVCITIPREDAEALCAMAHIPTDIEDGWLHDAILFALDRLVAAAKDGVTLPEANAG